MSSGTQDMPHKPPFILPEERERLSALGQRLRFARLRRGMSGADMAEQACVSRSTVFKVETGDPGATLGTYFRVLNALGLARDIDLLAANDATGRRLQDLALGLRSRATRKWAQSIIGEIDWDD